MLRRRRGHYSAAGHVIWHRKCQNTQQTSSHREKRERAREREVLPIYISACKKGEKKISGCHGDGSAPLPSLCNRSPGSAGRLRSRPLRVPHVSDLPSPPDCLPVSTRPCATSSWPHGERGEAQVRRGSAAKFAFSRAIRCFIFLFLSSQRRLEVRAEAGFSELSSLSSSRKEN